MMTTNKLQKWTVSAEILGGIAILVTLIVLILEVRENTETNRRTNMIQLTTAPVNAYLSNPNIQSVSNKVSEAGRASPVIDIFQTEFNLTYEEARLYSSYMGYSWRIRESEYLYGTTEPELFRENIKLYLRAIGDRVYWENNGHVFYHPGFRSYVENLLLEL